MHTPSSKLPGLLAVVILLAAASAWAETSAVYHIHLNNAGERQTPALIVMELDRGRPVAGVLTQPYNIVRGSRHYFWGSLAFVQLDVSGLTSEGGTLRGVATAQDVRIELNSQLDHATLSGDYVGMIGQREVNGGVLGVAAPRVRAQDADAALLYFNTPYPGSNNDPRWNGSAIRAIGLLALKQGQLIDGTMTGASPMSSAYGAKNQVVPRVPLAGGRSGYLAMSPGTTFTTQRVTGGVKDGRLEADIVVNAQDHGELTYRVNALVMGDSLFGEYVIVENGEATNHRNQVVGHIGATASAIARAPARPDMTEAQAKLYAHLQWLFDNPYCGGLFGSDLGLTRTSCTGDKQYDNPPMAGASAPIAMPLLASMSDDPVLRAHAMLAAQRGGHYLVSRRTGATRTPTTYKHMFWINFWMGRAFLDLHAATGDEHWLDRAKELADTLARVQLASGTWNWVDEASGKTGQSNRRHDREWDDIPLQCGDWLYFLGRLRVEAGVTDYLEMERKAAAWLRVAVEEQVEHHGVKYLWQERGDGAGEIEAIGPTFYALYLLDFAEKFDHEHLKKVMRFVDENLLARGADGHLIVKSFQPRHPPGFHAASTMRYALVNLKAARKTGEPGYQQQAGLLMASVLAMSDPRSGAIWGVPIPPDMTAYARGFQHPYTVFAADLAASMHQFIQIDKAAAEAGHMLPQQQ